MYVRESRIQATHEINKLLLSRTGTIILYAYIQSILNITDKINGVGFMQLKKLKLQLLISTSVISLKPHQFGGPITFQPVRLVLIDMFGTEDANLGQYTIVYYSGAARDGFGGGVTPSPPLSEVPYHPIHRRGGRRGLV